MELSRGRYVDRDSSTVGSPCARFRAARSNRSARWEGLAPREPHRPSCLARPIKHARASAPSNLCSWASNEAAATCAPRRFERRRQSIACACARARARSITSLTPVRAKVVTHATHGGARPCLTACGPRQPNTTATTARGCSSSVGYTISLYSMLS